MTSLIYPTQQKNLGNGEENSSKTANSFRNLCENTSEEEMEETASSLSPNHHSASPNSPLYQPSPPINQGNPLQNPKTAPTSPEIADTSIKLEKNEHEVSKPMLDNSFKSSQYNPNNFDLNHDYLKSEIQKMQKNSRSEGLDKNSTNYQNNFIRNHGFPDSFENRKLPGFPRENVDGIMSGVNNLNNINQFLSSGFMQNKDLPFYLNSAMFNSSALRNGFSSPTTNTNSSLSLSMMTLSPPQTLSPQNKSHVNISLSSSSASPKEDSQDEDENESDPMKRYYGNRKRLHDLSPSNLRLHQQNHSTPPLTPLNNNNNDSSKRDRNERNLLSPNTHPLLNSISTFPYFNSPISTAASIALLSHAKSSTLLNNGKSHSSDIKHDGDRNYPYADRFKDNLTGLQKPYPHRSVSSNSANNFGGERKISSPSDNFASPMNSATEKLINQQLSTTPTELFLKETTVPRKVRDNIEDAKVDGWNHLMKPKDYQLGVFAKDTVARGTRYGPFLGKWSAVISDPTYAWEVISKQSSLRGWIDAKDMGNWLRLVNVADNPLQGNLKHLLLQGQIFYETLRDISPGEELLLTRKALIDLDTSSITSGQSESTSGQNNNTSLAESRPGDLSIGDIGADSGAGDTDDENDDTSYQCLQCDKNFSDYETLDEHLVGAHGFTAGQFPCEHCPRAFCWRPNLIQHNKIHGLFKRYPCENCSKVFTDPAIYQKHIRSQHVGARSHACPECGKTFATSSGLKQHTHIHSSVKPFQCEVCFKAYTQFSNLCRHKRMHSGCRLQIKCEKCGQAFSTVTSLAKHKRFCDTAPSLSMNHHSNHHMSDYGKNPTPRNNFGMNNIPSTPPGSLMMYPRPPPMLPQSLLSNYPMFLPSLPSLVGGPQHPLLPPSLLLPYKKREENEESPIRSDRDVKPMLPEHSTSLGLSSDRDASSPFAKQLSTSMFSKGSQSPVNMSEDSSDNGNCKSDEEDLETTPSRQFTPSPIPEFTIKASNIKKESTPLDLTTRREDIEPLSISRVTSSSSPELMEENLKDQKNEESSKSELRTNHPFLSISDMLKESTPKTLSSESTPFNNPLETPTKFPLAYPKPLHPNYSSMFDACRNLERSQERNSLLQHSSVYSLMPQFFPHSNIGNLGNMGLNFNRASGLDVLKAHISASRPYSEFSRQYDMISPHISKPKDRYSCNYCHKVFPRSANLTRHLRTHTGEQPYKCKFCERSFSISSNLQRHVRNIHHKEKPYRCHLCERSFGQQTNLDRHLRHHEEGGADVPDSSSTSDTPVKYFNDEIRSFVDKVTDQSNDGIHPDDDDDCMMDDDDDKSYLDMSEETIHDTEELVLKRPKIE